MGIEKSVLIQEEFKGTGMNWKKLKILQIKEEYIEKSTTEVDENGKENIYYKNII